MVTVVPRRAKVAESMACDDPVMLSIPGFAG
jgi:hypothetical protein